MFPRYFVPDATSAFPAVYVPGWIVGTLRLTPDSAAPQEFAVTQGVAGTLSLMPPDLLSADLRTQLSHHELSCRRAAPLIRSNALWLAELHARTDLEGDPAGLLDPISFDATLTGPFPSSAPQVARGRLLLTRADLLQGLLQQHPDAFLALDSDQAQAEGYRCIPAVVPAEPVSSIQAGEGLLLSFFGLPSHELRPSHLVNESALSQLVHALLQEASSQKVTRGRVQLPTQLPVPSLAAWIAEKRVAGFSIEKGVAVRRSAGGFLGGILGEVERIPVPEEGDWESYRSLAEAALRALPGWPDARATALAARLKATVEHSAPVPRSVRSEGLFAPARSASSPAREPSVVSPAPAPGPLARPPAPARAGKAPADSGVSVSGPRGLKESARPAPRKASRPDWLDDFKQPMIDSAAVTARAPEAPSPSPRKADPDIAAGKAGSTPDWMKDFE